MKYLLKLFVIILVSINALGFYYEKQAIPEKEFTQEVTSQIEMPEDVKVLLDRSCLPCHGADGSGKAKMKWNYEKMPEYSKTKLISKLVKVAEKVEEDKMPPPKNIKKYPERKLTDAEKKIVMDWADGLAEKTAEGGE